MPSSLSVVFAGHSGKAKVSSEEIEAFTREANSGDYDRVLLTTMQWVSTS